MNEIKHIFRDKLSKASMCLRLSILNVCVIFDAFTHTDDVQKFLLYSSYVHIFLNPNTVPNCSVFPEAWNRLSKMTAIATS